MFGFQPFLAPELGYGKAVHHIMRVIAEHTRIHGSPPSAPELDRLFDTSFFLPAASKPAHAQLKRAAQRLVGTYLSLYADDLRRVWETERPFELHLPTAVINGRADVILDSEGDEVTALAIVDYKTSVDPDPSADADYALQLAVYADAGRREGLDVGLPTFTTSKAPCGSRSTSLLRRSRQQRLRWSPRCGSCAAGTSTPGRGSRADAAT